MSIPLVWFTLIAADARAHGRSAAFATACRAPCSVAALAMGRTWLSGIRMMACTEWHAPFLTDLFADGCFPFYGGLDYFVMPILAYLVAAVFGNPRPASYLLRRWRLTQLPKGQAAAVLALALVLVFFAAPAPGAGRPRASSSRSDSGPTPNRSPTRSMEMAANGPATSHSTRLPRGPLLLDLRWRRLLGGRDGGDGGDRFEQLGERKIDVLCDPVTMRFSDPERAASGIFSPIVFATGILPTLQRR